MVPFAPAGVLTTAEVDATMAYAEAEKIAATRRAYASDWQDFAARCTAHGACPLPAHQGAAAAYLSALAQDGRKASTIRGHRVGCQINNAKPERKRMMLFQT